MSTKQTFRQAKTYVASRTFMQTDPKLVGSIPAWAGEPRVFQQAFAPFWVYPRVGGGTVSKYRLFSFLEGLSPRGRGNLFVRSAINCSAGSIPAWAGEPAFVS